MIRYQPNNIIFRIASSDAISKFKELQAHSFIQLARKDLKFNASAREVVLLEYDRFSQWLFRIERICMAAQEGKMHPSLRSAIQESALEEIRVIENVLDSHPDIFNSKIAIFVKTIHNYSTRILHDRMEVSMNESIDRAFEQVVQIVSDYLQHVLMCLHEINNNLLTKDFPPFACIADFCIKCDCEQRFYPMRKRLEYFKSIGCGDTYVMKNYSEQDVYDEAQVYCAQYGISLTQELLQAEIQNEKQTAYA